VTVIVQARLEELSSKITVRIRRSVADIVQIGEWLNEARAICPHGQWEAWLKGIQFSPRMAQHWMNVHALVTKNEKFSLLPPTALLWLSAPSTPQGALQEVVRRLGNGESFTVEQVEEVLHKYRVLEGVLVGSQTLLATYGETDKGNPAKAIPRSAVTSAVHVAQEMLQRGAVTIDGEDKPMPDIRPEVMTQPILDVPALPNTFRQAVQHESKQRQQGHITSGTNSEAVGISIVVYKGDPARTLRALKEVLPASELYRLQDLIARMC